MIKNTAIAIVISATKTVNTTKPALNDSKLLLNHFQLAIEGIKREYPKNIKILKK